MGFVEEGHLTISQFNNHIHPGPPIYPCTRTCLGRSSFVRLRPRGTCLPLTAPRRAQTEHGQVCTHHRLLLAAEIPPASSAMLTAFPAIQLGNHQVLLAGRRSGPFLWASAPGPTLSSSHHASSPDHINCLLNNVRAACPPPICGLHCHDSGPSKAPVCLV